ncbi:hypothetical protein [Flavobacterium anhuiense]|uniref:hypothetical protein n=1 Tax=Flavobacterium anhuiense TaxID=459526 RepID=UPI003D962377
MKTTFFLITIVLFVNCSNPKKADDNLITNKNKTSHTQKDSNFLNQNDSTKKSTLSNTDIKILKATIVKNPYSEHKDIQIVFKNRSKKTIKAIKFEWSCINSFDEPANGKYFYAEGKYREKSVRLIKPKEIQTQLWEDFSTDANKITQIQATYIVYMDGTKWKLHKDGDSL